MGKSTFAEASADKWGNGGMGEWENPPSLKLRRINGEMGEWENGKIHLR